MGILQVGMVVQQIVVQLKWDGSEQMQLILEEIFAHSEQQVFIKIMQLFQQNECLSEAILLELELKNEIMGISQELLGEVLTAPLLQVAGYVSEAAVLQLMFEANVQLDSTKIMLLHPQSELSNEEMG